MQTVPQKVDTAREVARQGGDPTNDGFRSVTDADRQMQSGEMLLVEAYACFWLFAFVLIAMTWRQQRALDRRVRELEAALATASAPGKGAD